MDMRIIEKGWGHEEIWVSNSLYCGKKLVFKKANSTCSMHYHLLKTGELEQWKITTGDVVHNDKGIPHQLFALEDNSEIMEVSTQDDPMDNYRVIPGTVIVKYMMAL